MKNFEENSFLNRPSMSKSEWDTSERVIAESMVPVRQIAQRKPHHHLNCRFTVKNIARIYPFFFYSWIDKHLIFFWQLHTWELCVSKCSSLQHFWKYLIILRRQWVANASIIIKFLFVPSWWEVSSNIIIIFLYFPSSNWNYQSIVHPFLFKKLKYSTFTGFGLWKPVRVVFFLIFESFKYFYFMESNEGSTGGLKYILHVLGRRRMKELV